MIVCRKCGSRNGDADAFCGTCGSFLEFTGEKVTPAVSTEFRQQAEEEAAAPPVKRGLLDRMEGAVMSVLGPLPPDLVPDKEPRAEDADAEPPTAPPPDPEPPHDAPAPESESPASDLVAPVVPPLPKPREPAEQTPRAARGLAAAVTKTKPTRRLRPGDLICGQCGEGNPPVRKFCSRCGNSLLEAERVKASWWHRLTHWFRRGPRVVDLSAEDDGAGDGGARSVAREAKLRKAMTDRNPRQALRKLYRRGRFVLFVFLAIAVILYGKWGAFRYLIDNKVDAARARITGAIDIHYVPVHAVGVSANLQEQGDPGYNAVDDYLNTAWLARYSSADYPTLTLTFSQPVTLGRIILYSGVTSDYLAHGRPSLIVLVFSNDKSATLTPRDTPKEQILNIANAIQITSLKLEIEGTYPGTARPSDVAISDIELFKLG
jgi:ribosomal protein L40E